MKTFLFVFLLPVAQVRPASGAKQKRPLAQVDAARLDAWPAVGRASKRAARRRLASEGKQLGVEFLALRRGPIASSSSSRTWCWQASEREEEASAELAASYGGINTLSSAPFKARSIMLSNE